MMRGCRVEIGSYRGHAPHPKLVVTPGILPDEHELVDAVQRSNGDVIAIIKTKGHTYWSGIGMGRPFAPAEYTLVLLTPIEGDQNFTVMLSQLPRPKRKRTEIKGSYRFDQLFSVSKPGKKWRSELANLRTSMKTLAKG